MPSVIITGGSKGIGKEAVKVFSEKGFKVAFTYNSSENEAFELNKKFSALPFKADFNNATQTRKAIKEAAEALGGVDLLINNAGVASFNVFNNISEAEWERVLNINLFSVYRATQEVLPYMLKEKKGAIINISSIWGISGSSCESAYSTAKAGVIGLTKSLAKELALSNIRVNCIAPGVIDTPMNSTLPEETIKELCKQTPLGRLGKASDIVSTMLYLYENTFITGQTITVDGGFIL